MTIKQMAAVWVGRDVRDARKHKSKGRRGTPLAVQWLRLCVSTAGGADSIRSLGTKIPRATWRSQKKKKRRFGTSPDLLFLYLSNYHYGKKHTYLFALFVSVSHETSAGVWRHFRLSHLEEGLRGATGIERVRIRDAARFPTGIPQQRASQPQISPELRLRNPALA